MRKLVAAIAFALVAAGALYVQRGASDQPPAPGSASTGAIALDGSALQSAIRTRARDVQVTGSGTVDRVLADDRDGSRHQRFILRLASGETLLIAHNIDLAPRLTSLDPGERVEFAGEYEWTERGGVVHWTHHDPAGRHPGGWLRHEGRTAR